MKRFILFLLILVFTGAPLQALEMTGAIRNIFQWQRRPVSFVNSQKYVVNQSLLRLSFSQDLGSVRFKSAFEFNSTYNGSNLSVPTGWQATGRQLTEWQTNATLQSAPKSSIKTNIEHLEFAFTSGDFDFQVGRLPISLGTSHFIGILDFIDPFYPGYLDGSYKPGVDAIRIRTSAGETGEIEVIALAGGIHKGDTYLGRLRDTFNGIDCELIAGKFRGRNLLGFGWEGEKNKINLWGETALFERKKSEEANLGTINNKYALSWIVGAEKRLRRHWRGGIAYMHQDFGYRHVSDIANVYSSAPFREGWSYLSASDYGLITLSNAPNKASLDGIINLVDGSILWQSRLTISTSDDSDISIFGSISSGKSAGFQTLLPVVNSEFGSFGSSGGFVVRYFF